MSVCNRFSLITVAKIDTFNYKTMKFHYLFNEIHLFISFLNNNFMESSIRQRIKDVLSFHNSNTNQLAGDDANFQNRLSRQINHTSTISCDTISRVLSAYPEVSAEWLLRGKGKMLLTDNMPTFNGEETETEENLKIELSKVEAELEEYKLQNLRLEAQKDYLQERNDDLVVSCRMLQDELNRYQESKKKKSIV